MISRIEQDRQSKGELAAWPSVVRAVAHRLRFRSVGARLGAPTMVLMFIATAAVYVMLSRYQRENLLQAKESAATAVTQLFADTCASAIVFGDASGLKDELNTLGRNEEIEYAAVWAAEQTGAPASGLLGDLSRGPSIDVPKTPVAQTIERLANRLVIVAPVRDPSGRVVAVTALAFSLARENAAIAAMQRRTLAVSAVVAAGLTLLLMLIARSAIVRPLRTLAVAAKTLESGSFGEIDVRTDDEIGQLATAFRSMASAIHSREERINARNRDMRLVLDNVGQGFVTIDLAGLMSIERSRVLDEWFGPPEASMTFWDYLGRVNADTAQWFQMGWDAVREDDMTLELCLDQLPKRLEGDSRVFDLAYRPILRGSQLQNVVIVISDVTALIERERAEEAQREMMSLFRRITSDPLAFEEFFEESTALVDAISKADGSNMLVLKRQIHTLKGTCALFGVETVTSICHRIESRMEESGGSLDESEKAVLRTAWTRVESMRTPFAERGRVVVDEAAYDALLADLKRRVDHSSLIASVVSWKFEPASERLALLGEQVRHLASRLGKGEVKCVCAPTRLRLPPRKWAPFWTVFAHVVRNAVDHGVEPVDERLAAGKRPDATIQLGIDNHGPNIAVIVQDDGPGIDWTRIAELARQRGLKDETPHDLEDALFADGITSRSEATATSGRGVGLGAVREVVHGLGGHIEIDTQRGMGTTFRFILPRAMLFDEGRPPTTRPLAVKAAVA